MKFPLVHILHSDIIFKSRYRFQVDTACLYIQASSAGNSGLIFKHRIIRDYRPVVKNLKSGIVSDIIPQRYFGSK